MTAERFKDLERQGGCVDLSARAKFRLTGADRVRYLNGQVTNDVRKAGKDRALRACIVNLKGRIEAEVFIHVASDGEALLLDTEEGLREAIATRLERYIIADDVTLEDVTDQWRLRHWFAGQGEGAGGTQAGEGASRLVCSRLGVGGFDLWEPVSSSADPASEFLVSAEEAEILRILRGVPRWPAELNLETFPQEAGLEAGAMDFAKGCYIGQEVLSRIKTTGKMPKVGRRFEAAASVAQVEPGMKLVSAPDAAAGKEAGTVTSVVRHPLLDRWMGLAYVRQAIEGVDSLLIEAGDPPRILGDVKITPL